MKLAEPTAVSSSMEDYLEAILDLEAIHRVARPKDVATKLSVHKTTVTAALRTLAARGLVNHAPYGSVTLTDEGRRIALDVAMRHAAVRDFLENVLGIDADTADKAACRMEHALPREVVDRLLLLTESMRACPVSASGGTRASGLRRPVAYKDKAPAAAAPADNYSDVMQFFNP